MRSGELAEPDAVDRPRVGVGLREPARVVVLEESEPASERPSMYRPTLASAAPGPFASVGISRATIASVVASSSAVSATAPSRSIVLTWMISAGVDRLRAPAAVAVTPIAPARFSRPRRDVFDGSFVGGGTSCMLFSSSSYGSLRR